MEYGLFFDIWMWIGLGGGIVITVLLFATDFLRDNLNHSRFADPVWLAWLGAVAYMFHNVEEYGIDFTGTHLNFVNVMTDLFGPSINQWAYLGCNIPFVWVTGPLMAYLCYKKKLYGFASSMAIFEMLNGLFHVGQGLNMGYNSGLVTGVIIFLPIAAWTIYTVYIQKHLKWPHFFITMAAGILYHVLLIVGCRLAVAGAIHGIAQGIYMVIDAAVYVGILYFLNKGKRGTWQNLGSSAEAK